MPRGMGRGGGWPGAVGRAPGCIMGGAWRPPVLASAARAMSACFTSGSSDAEAYSYMAHLTLEFKSAFYGTFSMCSLLASDHPATCSHF